MQGFKGVNLVDILDDVELGESRAKSILSSFSCPLNRDVEDFIKNKAIMFAKQSLAATHLIFASYKGKYELVGYFALTTKFLVVYKDGISNSLRKRISKFCQYDNDLKRYTLSAPLIGQLGKNYTNGYDKLITGDELLKIACNKVREMQYIAGGKIVYLECEDKEKLIDFYSSNGFVNFGKRSLDKDETELMHGDYLVQMLKYLNKEDDFLS